MKKRISFIAFLTILVLLSSFRADRAQAYDKGGVFDFKWGVSDYRQRAALKTGLISFLRNAWTDQRRSMVKANFYSLEGDPFYSTFYIEPDKSGRWLIIEKWERICCALYPQMKPKRKIIKTRGQTVYKKIELLETVLRERIPF